MVFRSPLDDLQINNVAAHLSLYVGVVRAKEVFNFPRPLLQFLLRFLNLIRKNWHQI